MTNPKTGPAGEPEERSLAPRWLRRILNPVVRGILRSPAHRVISASTMLLTFTGAKSGTRYTTPVAYFAGDGDEVFCATTSRWWRNLVAQPAVTLRLRGRDIAARASVIRGPDGVAHVIADHIARVGLDRARRLPLGLPKDREPTSDDLRSLPSNLTVIRFALRR